MEKKKKELETIIKEIGPVVVACSGGVDSTLLAEVAHSILGGNALAVVMKTPFSTPRETDGAVEFLKKRGMPFHVIEEDLLSQRTVRDNPADRCYFCKKHILSRIIEFARSMGVSTVIEGSNVDDVKDHRPGERAIAELGVRSPLREAGLTKDEIRGMSRDMGLPTWNKPSEPCLATRIPYGERITARSLEQVHGAEEVLRDAGCDIVRVRKHGTVARIEIAPEHFSTVIGEIQRGTIIKRIKNLGFSHVSLDLEGYRTGSMNECGVAKMNENEDAIFETVYMLETSIDDMNPEYFEYVSEKLFQAGALEVYTVPVVMKKSRPGILLNVLTGEENRLTLMDIIFSETSTSGIRINEMKRRALYREIRTVATSYGDIAVKIMYSGGTPVTVSPEYEDCKKAARTHGIPLKEVYDEVRRKAVCDKTGNNGIPG